jgi:hypothetical protein
MKVPVIYYIEDTIYDYLLKKNICPEDELWIGFFLYEESKILTLSKIHNKIYLDSNFYRVLQKQARERNIYTGLLIGEMIAFRYRSGFL